MNVKPTSGELAILQVLWDRGPSTVREVHEALPDGAASGYTTTLKLMQIMAAKGLVERDETERAHVYRPALAEGEAKRQLAGELMDRPAKPAYSKVKVRALKSLKDMAK